jgi:hypothetical protein
VLRLEKEDPELLEMRRKALESLMKKTVKATVTATSGKVAAATTVVAAVDTRGDRKIIIPLNEASTSEDEGSSESESEEAAASPSEVRFKTSTHI